MPFAAGGSRRLKAPALAVPDTLPVAIAADMSTQAGFGALLNEIGKQDGDVRATHRHHLARRHRLDQSRRLGEPARAVRPRGDGRHLQERADPLDLQLGILAEGPARRARHRRDEPVHAALGARPLPYASTASGCCRSARSTIPSSRAASMRSTTPATRTPASSWWRRRPASRSRPRAAPTSRSPTPLIGMAQDGLAAFEPAFVDELAVILAWALRLHPERRRRGAAEACRSALGCATRPAARSICGSRPGRSSSSRGR